MPLTRYQLRNEYSLADPELYIAADKDDAEALLEGVAMAGLVGVLPQLGDLAEFAVGVFHDLHEEVLATAARGHDLKVRVQQLEAEVPSVEKTLLSQMNHASFFTNPELRVVERGRDPRADYKMVARALTTKGTALVKIAKCSKDYDIAIETFQKALTERHNPDTLKKLNDAEKAKKDLEQQEYFDPKIADEEREKGNEFFKQMKYPEAIKQYSEVIGRKEPQ